MTKRKRKKVASNSNEHNSGGLRWLLTYADMITLLLIFFIIMYSISATSASRFAKFVNTVQRGFSVFSYANPGLPADNIPERGKTEKNDIVNYLNEEIKFLKVKEGLVNTLKTEIANGEISLSNEERGLVIRINDRILFNNDIRLTRKAQTILSKISTLIKSIPNKIAVEGHTDNTPTRSSLFPTNWEFSALKAANVTRYFIEKCSIEPARFSITGYAGYRPVSVSGSPKEKEKNKRIEIVVLLKTDTT